MANALGRRIRVGEVVVVRLGKVRRERVTPRERAFVCRAGYGLRASRFMGLAPSAVTDLIQGSWLDGSGPGMIRGSWIDVEETARFEASAVYESAEVG